MLTEDSKRMLKKLPPLILLLFMMSVTVSIANDYSIPEITIEVEILDDGTVRFTEHLTYVFDGSFSWADHRFPRKGFGEATNISVSEGNESYINNNSESPGTFSVSETDRNLIIKWHYSATDTTRTFTISYDLTGALSVGEEWVQFYWNYLASGRSRSTDNLTIQITLPEETSPETIYAWTRLPAENHSIAVNERGITLTGSDISRGQLVSIRSLFPRSLFDEALLPVNEPLLTLEMIMEEEEEIAAEMQRKAERDAFYASITQPVTLLLVAISIAVFIFFYQKYGKRHTTKTISDQQTILLPDRTKPAIIGRLLSHSTTTGNHLTATIFDLARRGWFSIHEEKKENRSSFSSESTQFRISVSDREPEEIGKLAAWEKQTIHYVKEQISGGTNTFDKLFTSKNFTKWYSQWMKEIKKEYDALNWIDSRSMTGLAIHLIIQLLLFLAAVAMLIFGSEFAVIGIVSTGIMCGASAAILRRTEEGETMFRRWNAYLKGLQNADKRTINMEMLGHHFIYATAFGISQKKITVILEKSSDDTAILFPWIVLMAGSNTTPATVASSISTLSASGTSSFSGSVGGSGASIGSAGGGASSGAG
ncbi:MAG: DUF2207 domain-containing protein [Balneolaceae bacterium]|nr:MAG: DUF2207 domain-containing protein [Balneolaceae bacterium]